MPIPERIFGLPRWKEWLERQLSPAVLIREKSEKFDSTDAVWSAVFPDGTSGLVRVTDAAIRLSEEDLHGLMGELVDRDLRALLMAAPPGGIRIRADGTITMVKPAGRRLGWQHGKDDIWISPEGLRCKVEFSGSLAHEEPIAVRFSREDGKSRTTFWFRREDQLQLTEQGMQSLYEDAFGED